MSTGQAVAAVEFSSATQQRFAREVAKYPADQKQSAVMACLSIIQQEHGLCEHEAQRRRWPPTWAWSRSPCTR